jgi:hypothetical protein
MLFSPRKRLDCSNKLGFVVGGIFHEAGPFSLADIIDVKVFWTIYV